MSNACETSVESSLEILGGSEFHTRPDRSVRCRQLAEQGYLVARVAPAHDTNDPTSSSIAPSSGALERGHLRLAIEGAVEISLALRGAPPPRTIGEEETEVAAINQLARLKMLDASGLCLVLPELRGLADAHGTLDIADSTTLDVWRELAETDAVFLLLDDGDRELNMLAPRRLSQILGTSGGDGSDDEPMSWADDVRDSDEQTRLADDGAPTLDELTTADERVDEEGAWLDAEVPSLKELCAARDDEQPDPEEPCATPDDDELDQSGDRWSWYDQTEMIEAAASDVNDETQENRSSSVMRGDPLAGIEQLDPSPEPASQPELEDQPDWAVQPEQDLQAEQDVLPEEPTELDHEPILEDSSLDPSSLDDQPSFDEYLASDSSEDDEPMFAPEEEPQIDDETESAPIQGSLFDINRPESRQAPPPPLKPIMSVEQCRQHCAALAAANGPKPVTMIEELFCKQYSPLLEALSCGLDHEEAEQAVTDWRTSFEKSYVDGFNAMRVTGKRPTMVLDAADIATGLARLNGARSVQLLLIDSMRFDLSQRVAAKLEERLAGQGHCVDQTLLWSALPTITPTQLHLLARGPRGLIDSDPPSDREPIIQRGNSVTTLRRVRIGQRDLVKLDVVEARLREVGGGFESRMDGLSDEVSDIVARFGESLATGTLLFIFGDHGFQLPTQGRFQSGIARQGGASPEEALVGSQSWLIGDVQ